MGGCATKPKVLTEADDVTAPVAAPETPVKEEISMPAEIETIAAKEEIAAPIVQVEKGETLKEEEIVVGNEEKTRSLGTLFNEKENEANIASEEAATETEIPKEEDKTTSSKEEAVTIEAVVNTQEPVEAEIKAQAPADDVPAAAKVDDEEKVIQVTPAPNAITETKTTEVSTVEENKTQESK